MRIAIGLLLAAAAAASTAPPGAFTVGVLRRDGLVVPFATYDGTRWRTDWPEPKVSVDVPIDVRNVPSRWWGPMGPLETWQIWLRAQPPRLVHVRQPDWFQTECQKQIGLRTDYAPSEDLPGPEAQPYPKDGLAVSPAQPIERIEIATPGARPSVPPPGLVDAFNDAEDRALSRLNKKQRRLVPLKMEAVYAVGDPKIMRVYYFEVSKEYPSRESDECPILSFGRGWFVAAGNTSLRKLTFDVQLADCERWNVTYMLPLGAVRLSNRLFWIAQWSGWDHEHFEVVEITPKGVERAVAVPGGGC